MSKRIYETGAKKRKQAKEKGLKQEELLAKVLKLTNFFKKSAVAAVGTEVDTKTNIEDIQIQDIDSPTPSTSKNNQNSDINVSRLSQSQILMITSSQNKNKNIPDLDNNSSTCFENSDFNFMEDPKLWHLNDININYITKNFKPQNIDSLDFSNSGREYEGKNGITRRYANKTIFYTTLPNGKSVRRSWIYYSDATKKVYCIPCKLFCTKNNEYKEGFNDWKHCDYLHKHEKTLDHVHSINTFITRAQISGRVDTELEELELTEKQYFKEVLKRVISVIKYIATRNLAFRGSKEVFGSSKNGNFLGLLELIAEFDPFLKQHIEKYGNFGSGGRATYLSKTTAEVLLNMLASKVQKQFYFSNFIF